jgi:hypothetical protein
VFQKLYTIQSINYKIDVSGLGNSIIFISQEYYEKPRKNCKNIPKLQQSCVKQNQQQKLA